MNSAKTEKTTEEEEEKDGSGGEDEDSVEVNYKTTDRGSGNI